MISPQRNELKVRIKLNDNARIPTKSDANVIRLYPISLIASIPPYSSPHPLTSSLSLFVIPSPSLPPRTLHLPTLILFASGAFMHFMNDHDVQEMIHVRGFDLPGLNFNAEKRGEYRILTITDK